MVTTSVAAQFWAPAHLALEFDRHAIAAGQWWRLVSGNLVHYSWLHLAADAWPFVVLCYLARRQRLAVGRVVLAACVTIGLAVYFLTDGIDTYRGLSGVDMTLLAAVLTRLAWSHSRRVAIICAGVIALEASKAIFDVATGGLALPTVLPNGISVVGIAHLVGLGVGVAAAWPMPRHAGRPRRSRPSSPTWAVAETQAASPAIDNAGTQQQTNAQGTHADHPYDSYPWQEGQDVLLQHGPPA